MSLETSKWKPEELRRFKHPIPWGKGKYVGKKKSTSPTPTINPFLKFNDETLKKLHGGLHSFDEKQGAECYFILFN